jgi:endonuclease/exonuclease/phosphatase family metal-dependent hydrolase
VRLVSYNILNGGEGRADPLAEVLIAQRPDIVVLLEADDAAVLDRIALRLRMDHIHFRGSARATAVLSRWSFTETIDHAVFQTALEQPHFEASVEDPNGRAWRVTSRRATHRRSSADDSPHLLVGNFDEAESSKLLRNGYSDTLAMVDEPAARTSNTFPTQYPTERVDRIFTFGFDHARIRDAWVEQDRLAKYASDHFPVGVEIE